MIFNDEELTKSFSTVGEKLMQKTKDIQKISEDIKKLEDFLSKIPSLKTCEKKYDGITLKWSSLDKGILYFKNPLWGRLREAKAEIRFIASTYLPDFLSYLGDT